MEGGRAKKYGERQIVSDVGWAPGSKGLGQKIFISDQKLWKQGGEGRIG